MTNTNRTQIRFDDTKAQAEAWRMLRGDISLDMGYLIELVEVHPARFLPKVTARQMRSYLKNFVYCQACGDVLSVDPCVTCLGVGVDGCSECGGLGGLVYCQRCDDGDGGDDDEWARL